MKRWERVGERMLRSVRESRLVFPFSIACIESLDTPYRRMHTLGVRWYQIQYLVAHVGVLPMYSQNIPGEDHLVRPNGG